MRKKISNFTFEKFVFFLFLFALTLISGSSAGAQTIISDSGNILEIKANSSLTTSTLRFVPSTSANSFSLQGIAPGATTVSIFDYLSSNSLFKMLNGTLNYNPSNNYIGIGTTAPSEKLEVAGNIFMNTGYLMQTDTWGMKWKFAGDSDTVEMNSSETAWKFNIAGGGVTKYRFNSSKTGFGPILDLNASGSSIFYGNVGIGTTAPSYKLDVAYHSNGVNFNGNYLHNVSAPSTTTDAINKGYLDSSLETYGSKWILSGSNLYPSSTAWNVGIGTMAPLAKLQINNEGAFNTVTPGPAAYYGLHFGGQTTADYATGITWSGGTSGTQAGIYVQGSGSYGSKMYFATTNSYATGAQNRMIINESGNVGIGTTAPGAFRLYVNGATYTSGNLNVGGDATISGGDVSISNNNGGINFNDASAYWLKTATNYGIYWDTTANQFKFNGAGVTKASVDLDDGAAYFNGSVGIGTNAPSAKLTVSGGNIFITDAVISSSTPHAAVTKTYLDSAIQALASTTSYWSANGANIFNTNTGNVGIGTNNPNQQLEITKNFKLPNTTGTTPYGVIYKGSNSFIHDFNYGLNGNGITTSGGNTFVGLNAGNFTMGSTATSLGQSSGNTGVGYYSLFSNTTGYSNSALGYQSLLSNTTGHSNSALGYLSLSHNTTGYGNSALGYLSLENNTTGGNNSALGFSSLRSNTTGGGNSAFGYDSLVANSTGSFNSAFGDEAGKLLATGGVRTTGDLGLYLGYSSKASADGTNNEIVIGALAVGNGSNTVTLGNDSIAKTVLKGNVGIGTTTPVAGLEVLTGSNYSILAGGKRVGNVAAPTQGTDAVNRNYVDSNFIASTSLATITNAFVQGGNSFGVKAILGTNDNQALGIETNGTEKMTILANGNVGIGTTAPSVKLHLADAGDVMERIWSGSLTGKATVQYLNNSMNYETGIFSDNSYGINAGASRVLTVLGGGNVGIGTTNPGAKLDVVGSIRTSGDIIVDGNYGTGLVGLYSATRYQNVFSMGAAYRLAANGTAPGNMYGIAWTHSNIGGQSKSGLAHQALFMNNGVTQTAIGTGIWTLGGYTQTGSSLNTFSGNVGVGVSPTHKLHVAGDASFSDNQIHGVSAPATGTDAANRFYVDGLITDLSGQIAGISSYWSASGTNIFNNNTGNVGIGISAPLAKLQINNEAAFNTLTPGPAAYYGLHFGGQTTADYATGITWSGGTSGTQAGIYVQGSGAYGSRMYFATTNSYATGAQNRMIISESGNVGIGTTAPGAYKLYVNGAAYASGNLNVGGDATVSGGDIYDASGDLHVLGEDNLYLKMDYNNDDADIRNIIFAKNTGLATAPTVANELMRITEAGNVGIGISNPSYLLHVKGEASFGNSVVHEVSAPVTSTDAVNRYYVDTNFAPLSSSFWTPNPNNPNHIYNTNSGYVGIGVSAPAQKLDVAGTINASSGFKVNNTATSGYYLRGNGTNYVASTIQASDVPTLNQNTSGSAGTLTYEDRRTITPANLNKNLMKFGFTSYNNNNTSPWADFLHFRSYGDSSGGKDNLLVFNKTKFGMRLYQQDYESVDPYVAYQDVVLAQNSPVSGYLTKYAGTGDTVNVTNSQIYDNGTSVGIGTTTLGYKLHVAGTSYLNGTIKTSLSGTGSRCLHVDSNGVIGTMAGDCGTSTGGDNLGNHTATENIKLGNYWLSGDGGNEGIFVKSDGNVGVGTNYPDAKLNLNGSASSTILLIDSSDPNHRAQLKVGTGSNNAPFFIDSLFRFISQPTFGGSGLSLNPSGGSITAGGTIYNTNASYWLRFDNALTDSLRVQGDLNTTGILKSSGTGANYMMGRLGLGTTNPATTAGMTIDTPVASSSILFRGAGTDKAILSFKNGINFTMNSSIGAPVVPGNTGSYNIGIGSYTFYTGTGSSNIGIGVGAARSSSGNGNIAIGISAMDSTGAGSSNIAIGNSALYQGTSGAYNIAIGVNALNGSGIGDGNIAIGNRGQWTNSSNKLYIGDLNPGLTDLPLIYGDMTSTTTGAVGIKTTNLQSGMAMTVAGKIYAEDFIYFSSDERLKHDIKNLGNLDYQKILKLRPVSFTYNKNNSKGFGFIAQELEKIYPEMVETNQSDGMKSVTYDNLISPTIMAIQEQQKKIEEQETLIHILLDRVNKLENSTK